MATKEINMTTILEIKKARRNKKRELAHTGALEEYEKKQAEIKKLLKQIDAGLQAHDRAASGTGHHWGHVGDLTDIAEVLTDIKDRLHQTGEYVKAGR
jgi:hypothetical protein